MTDIVVVHACEKFATRQVDGLVQTRRYTPPRAVSYYDDAFVGRA